MNETRRMIEASNSTNVRLALERLFHLWQQVIAHKSANPIDNSRFTLRSNTMLIDSHCHLNYLDNPEEAVERAKEAGVTSCLCISVDEAGFLA